MEGNAPAPANVNPNLQAWYAEGRSKGYLAKNPAIHDWVAEGVKRGYLKDESGASVYADTSSAQHQFNTGQDTPADNDPYANAQAAFDSGVDQPDPRDPYSRASLDAAMKSGRMKTVYDDTKPPVPAKQNPILAGLGKWARSLLDAAAGATAPAKPAPDANGMYRDAWGNVTPYPTRGAFTYPEAPVLNALTSPVSNSVRNFTQGALAPGLARAGNAPAKDTVAQNLLSVFNSVFQDVPGNIKAGARAVLNDNGPELIGKQVPELAPGTLAGDVLNTVTGAATDPLNLLLAPTGAKLPGVRALVRAGKSDGLAGIAGEFEQMLAGSGPNAVQRASDAMSDIATAPARARAKNETYRAYQKVAEGRLSRAEEIQAAKDRMATSAAPESAPPPTTTEDPLGQPLARGRMIEGSPVKNGLGETAPGTKPESPVQETANGISNPLSTAGDIRPTVDVPAETGGNGVPIGSDAVAPKARGTGTRPTVPESASVAPPNHRRLEETSIDNSSAYLYAPYLRPAGTGTVPEGWKYHYLPNETPGSSRNDGFTHGVIQYDHPLSAEEIRSSGLIPYTKDIADVRPVHYIAEAYKRLGLGDKQKTNMLDQEFADAVEKGVPVPAKPATPTLKGATGDTGTTYTPDDNTPVPYRWRVVDADSLTPSQADTLGPHPSYPQELQPRDRTRAASAAQISEIAGNLNPARMGEAPTTADGAPVVGPEGFVESGNGRTLAIRRAYQQHPAQAAAYKASVLENAPQLGIDPAEIARMAKPVLVRERTGDLSLPDRATLAGKMGASTVAGMSEPEVARADGRLLRDSPALDKYQAGADVLSPANNDFRRAFLSELPPGERAGLMQSDGTLSSAGVRRVRNALLASAYDDSHTLSRMTEATDDNVKSVGQAMEATAPQFARLRKQASALERDPSLDITGDITTAANALTSLRAQNGSVAGYLSQMGLFGDALSPAGEETLRLFDDYKRRPKVITDTLTQYARGWDLMGSPNQAVLFGENAKPDAHALLRAAREHAENTHGVAVTKETNGVTKNEAVNNAPALDFSAAQAPRPAPAPERAVSATAREAAPARQSGSGPAAVAENAEKPAQSRTTAGTAPAPANRPEVVPAPAPGKADKPNTLTLTADEATVLSGHVGKALADKLDKPFLADEKRTHAPFKLTKSEQDEIRRAARRTDLDATDPAVKTLRKKVLPQAQGAAAAPPKKDGSVTLQASIFGADQIIKNDILPFLGMVSKAGGEVRKLLDPGMGRADAGLAMRIVRANAGRMARRFAQAQKATEDARAAFARLPVTDAHDFIANLEDGAPQANPDLQPVADLMRKSLDDTAARIRLLGPGHLDTVIADYFPHIWQNPAKAEQVFGGGGKKPLAGSGAFKKQRTIATVADGLAAGLKLASDNPIDIYLLKLSEMLRYEHAQDIIKELKGNGLLEHVGERAPSPDGYAKVNDRLFDVVQYKPTTKADGSPGSPDVVRRGSYQAPEAVARVLNNYLSPGLRGHAWYNLLRNFGNGLNQMQLGLSAFHFSFTSMDATVSKADLAVQKLFGGNPGGALKDVANVPTAALTNLMRGEKARQEYYYPGTFPELSDLVDMMVEGGGRVKMDDFFRVSAGDNAPASRVDLSQFVKAIKEGRVSDAVEAALPRSWPLAEKGALLPMLPRIIADVLELTAAPLMEEVVPRQKLGICMDQIAHEWERLGPGATLDQRRKAAASVVDSVDNRMGQVIYDNLFWNKTLKDLLMISVRSVGFSMGTLRELGGAVYDIGTIGTRAKNGDSLFTRRMGYAVALPVVVGLAGVIYQYLATGEHPQDWKDYFYPRTGRLRPDGKPERIVLPSYMKDAFAYGKHPLTTLGHKANPGLSTILDLNNNEDFYGNEIIDHGAPFDEQLKQGLSYLAQQALPMSVRNAKEGRKSGDSKAQQAQSFAGIGPAPADIDRSAAENMVIAMNRAKMPGGARTPDQAAKMQVASDLKTGLRVAQQQNGKEAQSTAVRKALEAARAAGATDRTIEQAAERRKEPMLTSGFRRLTLPEAVKVWGVATPDERKPLREMMGDKIDRYFDEHNDRTLYAQVRALPGLYHDAPPAAPLQQTTTKAGA